MVDFSSNLLLVNLALFAVGAVAIWRAGTKLERYVDHIAAVTGLGKAFLGIVLLATATSLPELSTSLTATLSGNSAMAVHNLLGGVVFQTAVLAFADLAAGRRALTGQAPHFALLMEGVGLILILATALVGMSVSSAVQQRGSTTLAGIVVIVWSLGLLAAFLLMLLLTKRSQTQPRWRPKFAEGEQPESSGETKSADEREADESAAERSLGGWLLRFCAASGVVLVAGWLVARTGEAIATQTGLGTTFIGFTLVAIATSLPELSTTTAAARAGRYESAISNVYGSNAFDVTLLTLVALVSGTQILEVFDASALFAAALGVLLTAIYLWGLLERRDRTIWRFGWDSAAVVICALFGNGVIFWLR